MLPVLVNGTTGEGVSQNIEERKLLTEEWVKVAKKTEQSLMVHIGGASLTDVIDLVILSFLSIIVMLKFDHSFMYSYSLTTSKNCKF